MATNTTPRGYRYPDGNEPPAIDVLLAHLAQDVDTDVEDVEEQIETVDAKVTLLRTMVSAAGTTPQNVTGNEVAVPGAVVNLAAGKWHVIVTGYADVAGSGTPKITVRLRHTTVAGALFGTAVCGTNGTTFQMPFTIQAELNPGSGTVPFIVSVQNVGTTGGTVLVAETKIIARRVS